MLSLVFLEYLIRQAGAASSCAKTSGFDFLSMKDIPLKKAIISWNPGVRNLPESQEVIVYSAEGEVPAGYSSETNAYFPFRRDVSDAQRLNMLIADAWRISCVDGVSSHVLHEALLVIPEYKEFCNWFFQKSFTNSPLID